MADRAKEVPTPEQYESYQDGYYDAIKEQFDDALRRMIDSGASEQEIHDRVCDACRPRVPATVLPDLDLPDIEF